ncbi:MAG: hypothetical protein CFH01_01645, partial [Alphaproteobacteria bacterium MarineAlpha2_Bin1]
PLETQVDQPVEQLVTLLNQAQQQLASQHSSNDLKDSESKVLSSLESKNILNSSNKDQIRKNIFNKDNPLIRDLKLNINKLEDNSTTSLGQKINNSDIPSLVNTEKNSRKVTTINEILIKKDTQQIISESIRNYDTLTSNPKGNILKSNVSEFETSFNSNKNDNRNSFFNAGNKNLNNQITAPRPNNLIQNFDSTFNSLQSQVESEISITKNIEIKLNPVVAKSENFNFQNSSFLPSNLDNSLNFSSSNNTVNEILNNNGPQRLNRAIHTQTFLPIHEQIAVNISKAVGEGVNKIQIQLQPSDMGKVEIQLDVSREGRVIATVLADKPETLENLQRDSKSLERALQQAGLQTNSESLNFGLRDDQNGQLNPENQDSNENSLEEENSVVETLSGSIKSIPRPFGFSEGAIDLSV